MCVVNMCLKFYLLQKMNRQSLSVCLLDSANCYTFKINKPRSFVELKQVILTYVRCIDFLENTTIDKLRVTFDDVLLLEDNYCYLRHMDKVYVRVYDNGSWFPFLTRIDK